MPISNTKYIMGERFWLKKKGLNKTDAEDVAGQERKAGHKARLEKVARGNYIVWTTRRYAFL